MTQRARQPRIHRPARKGGTARATGATFRQLTQHVGTGVMVAPAAQSSVFSGPDAKALAKKYGGYDAQCQSWIALALRQPFIRAKMRVNVGTAPELALCGRFLSQGYILHRTLFFQEQKLSFFRHFSRVFTADVAIVGPGGGLILIPVDGLHFHNRTLREQIDTQAQHNALTRLGKVVAIPDTECLSAVRMENYLRRHGCP